LKSLTIGPQLHKTNAQFWEEALNDLPPLRRVNDVTIIYNYTANYALHTDCWEYFDRILASKVLFPALKSLSIETNTDSRGSYYIDLSLPTVRATRGLTLAISGSPAFERDHRTDPLMIHRVDIVNAMKLVDNTYMRL